MDDLLRVIQSTVQLEEAIDADVPLVSSGLIDSFDLVAVVTAIEEHYGVQIAVEDISVDTFDTPRQMMQWINGRHA